MLYVAVLWLMVLFVYVTERDFIVCLVDYVCYYALVAGFIGY